MGGSKMQQQAAGISSPLQGMRNQSNLQQAAAALTLPWRDLLAARTVLRPCALTCLTFLDFCSYRACGSAAAIPSRLLGRH